MPRIASLVVLAACSKAAPEAPPVPSVAPKSVDAITSDGPVDATLDAPAVPIDAPMAFAPHRFIKVIDFSEMPYLSGAIETPGLPAIHDATIAVAYIDEDGLGTLPNVAVYLLDASGTTAEKIAIWSQAESRKFIAGDDSPAKLRALALAIDAKITAAEKRLDRFTSLEQTCEGSDPALGDDAPAFPYCDGHEIWTCGSTVLTNPRTTKTGRREKLTIKAGKTISTKAWHKPPVQIYSGKEKVNKEETVACIHDARLIANKVLLELRHNCNVSGDWCSAGGPTWHVVEIK